jgi:hypothetical protein
LIAVLIGKSMIDPTKQTLVPFGNDIYLVELASSLEAIAKPAERVATCDLRVTALFCFAPMMFTALRNTTDALTELQNNLDAQNLPPTSFDTALMETIAGNRLILRAAAEGSSVFAAKEG